MRASMDRSSSAISTGMSGGCWRDPWRRSPAAARRCDGSPMASTRNTCEKSGDEVRQRADGERARDREHLEAAEAVGERHGEPGGPIEPRPLDRALDGGVAARPAKGPAGPVVHGAQGVEGFGDVFGALGRDRGQKELVQRVAARLRLGFAFERDELLGRQLPGGQQLDRRPQDLPRRVLQHEVPLQSQAAPQHEEEEQHVHRQHDGQRPEQQLCHVLDEHVAPGRRPACTRPAPRGPARMGG